MTTRVSWLGVSAWNVAEIDLGKAGEVSATRTHDNSILALIFAGTAWLWSWAKHSKVGSEPPRSR